MLQEVRSEKDKIWEAHNEKEHGGLTNIPPKWGSLRIVGKRRYAGLWDDVRFAETCGKKQGGNCGQDCGGNCGQDRGLL